MSEMQDAGAPPGVEAGVGPSAGERLRLGREQAGWTVERLAGELCLPVDRLRALEADEFAGFGGAVFVRGYLRRAAAVLGLPPAEIIAGYEAASGVTRPADSLPELPPGAPPRRGMPEWAGRAAVTALAVGAIAFTWWFMQPPDAPAPTAAVTPPAAEPAQRALPEPEAEVSPQSQPVAAEEDAAPAEAGPAATESPSRNAAAPLDEQSPAPPTATADGAEALSAEVFTALGGDALEVPVTVELRFEFAEDCWVEINDALGTRLAYRLYRAGDVARLRGVAPVEVFLGNAEGVRLTVDDTPVAVRPAARRDGTARLMVGGGTG